MLIPPAGLSPHEDCGVLNATAVGVCPVEDQPAVMLVTVKVTAPGFPLTNIPGHRPDEHGATLAIEKLVAPVTGAGPVIMVIVCVRLKAA